MKPQTKIMSQTGKKKSLAFFYHVLFFPIQNLKKKKNWVILLIFLTVTLQHPKTARGSEIAD